MRWAWLMLLAGCMKSSTVLLAAGPPAPAVAPDQVTIYRTADQVPRPYDEIALLDVGSGVPRTDAQYIARLRKQAAAVGADGIILEPLSSAEAMKEAAATLTGAIVVEKRRAVAIRFRPKT